jgi:hypothetical protein
VFLAKPAYKASFLAGYCLHPQGPKSGLFISQLKTVLFRRKDAENAQKITKMAKKVQKSA